MVNETTLLPVRLVQPSRDFLHRDEKRGGPAKLFITDETEFKSHQENLEFEIDEIEKDLGSTFEAFPQIPAVVKVELRDDAWAKSHRPTELFSMDTCPIIGLNNIGEVLVSATKTGLSRLKTRIFKPTNKNQKANITTVKNIAKFEDKDKLLGLNLKQLISKSQRDGTTCLKIILFDHHDPEINENIKNLFLSWAKKKSLKIENISILNGLDIWRLMGVSKEEIKEMTALPSVRMVSFFPTYRLILQKSLISSQKISGFPTPIPNKEYPKIAVVDSGIPKTHQFLSPWIIDRVSFVPESYQDNKHGSFVSGLICMGTQLNGRGICPDDEPIQVVDIQMLSNPGKDKLTEDFLVERLQACVPQITKKYNIRIWNMSAGFDCSIEDEQFSSLAIFLDKLQDKHDIIFTLPSGNYESPNQRTWPPQHNLDGEDKLQIPADSVRAITVGAIACKEKPDSIVKINQPTSYSCRGPGPTYIPKPEIVHYSGNLTIDNGKLDISNQGILSFDENGNIVEDVGTSYSCPLGARSMAVLYNQLLDSTSNNMIKALTIHNSEIPENLGSSEEIFHHVGFGKPEKVESILTCKETEITLMFEQEIYEKHTLIYPFMWPESLRDGDGKCRGKVKMTIVASVPLDESYGSEYIRANVSASLQEKYLDKDGKEQWRGIIDSSPDTSDLSKCYEKDQIRHFLKWSTIKKYEKVFHRKKIDDVRIQVSLLLRDGMKLGIRPIKFALVFTISDQDELTPIYNEVVVGLRNKNVITNPIQLRMQIRQGVRS